MQRAVDMRNQTRSRFLCAHGKERFSHGREAACWGTGPHSARAFTMCLTLYEGFLVHHPVGPSEKPCEKRDCASHLKTVMVGKLQLPHLPREALSQRRSWDLGLGSSGSQSLPTVSEGVSTCEMTGW